MAIMDQVRSPLPWIGGKHYSAQCIISQFPAAQDYDIYVDPFGGGANILLNKPVGRHLEVYNDINSDLVNCWMHLRDHPEEMGHQLRTLPYARSLYQDYHTSLYDGTEMENLERAVRWFYVLRSSFRAEVNEVASGWNGSIKDRLTLSAKTYRNSLDFATIAQRFAHVNIDCRDFEDVVKQYGNVSGLRTLVYADPPYIGREHYYKQGKESEYLQFHQRVAHVLNETQAMVALSYYDHPLLDELYPSEKWRCTTWKTIKHSQRTRTTRDEATEVLLMNYDAVVDRHHQGILWEEDTV